MEPDQRFVVGDRVRLIVPLEGVPSGYIGTVRQVFWDADLYAVGFGAVGAALIVHHQYLELAEPTRHERSAGSANGAPHVAD